MIKLRILGWLAKDYVAQLDAEHQARVDQRVAEIVAKHDPFEALLKNFEGTFSEDYERAEERLDAAGQMAMKLWGYQQAHDPSFKYVLDWIMNKAGNKLIQTGLPSVERQLFTRAQISTMLLLRKEARRLSMLYEELIGREEEFISDSLV